MTTCPEVGLAKELAIPYASIAIVTDYDCWRENVDDSEHVGVEAVLAMFRANIEKVTDLILGVIPKIAEKDWRPVWESARKLVDSSIL
jgi:5'-methylthioadenosine phosphorylase